MQSCRALPCTLSVGGAGAVSHPPSRRPKPHSWSHTGCRGREGGSPLICEVLWEAQAEGTGEGGLGPTVYTPKSRRDTVWLRHLLSLRPTQQDTSV